MTYFQHLINFTRLKAAIWVFIGGFLAFALANLATVNILTITWPQVLGILATAFITQVTKALSNYTQQ